MKPAHTSRTRPEPSKEMPAGRWLQGVLVQIARQAQRDAASIDARPKEATHSLRRRMKKIQSLLRLAAPAVDDESHENLKAGIRGIKDALTANRDADVLDDLGRDLGVVRAMPRDIQPDAAMLDAFLSELATSFEDMDLSGLTWNGVSYSHLKTCRQARKAWKKADRHPSAKNLHAWRKRVKDQYHQSLALHRWLGEDSRVRKIRRLGSLLGKCHDLDLFACTIDGSAGRVDKKLRREVGSRRKKLKRRAFRRAEKIFSRPLSKAKRRLAEELTPSGSGRRA